MKQITIDIETASDENIKDCGVYRYAESECFDLLLVSYAVDNGPVATCDIANGETLPDDVRNALTDKTVTKRRSMSISNASASLYTYAESIRRCLILRIPQAAIWIRYHGSVT